jgi:hypothetical protein
MKLISFLHFKPFKKEPELSLRRAAAIYKVCRKKLGRRQQGMQPRCDIMANSRKLTNLEEEKLVEYILDMDSRGFPPRIKGVEDMANILLY